MDEVQTHRLRKIIMEHFKAMMVEADSMGFKVSEVSDEMSTVMGFTATDWMLEKIRQERILK